jgi:hypothetical protein
MTPEPVHSGAPAAAVAKLPEPTLQWSVSRGVFAVSFILLYGAISGLLLLAAKHHEWVHGLVWMGAFIAPSAWYCLWTFLTAGRYQLTHDTFRVISPTGVKSIPLTAITGLTAELFSGEGRRLFWRGGTLRLPGNLLRENGAVENGATLLREFQKRIWNEAEPLHRARPGEEQPWLCSEEAPTEMLEVWAEWKAKGLAEQAYLFTGPFFKPGTARRCMRSFFFWGAVLAMAGGMLSGLLDNGREKTGAIIGVCYAAPFLLFWALTYTLYGFGRKEYLLIGKGGIVMLGKHLTGELRWEQVSSVLEVGALKRAIGESAPVRSPSGLYFYITTKDGAMIPIPDVYDLPIHTVQAACFRAWKARLQP